MIKSIRFPSYVTRGFFYFHFFNQKFPSYEKLAATSLWRQLNSVLWHHNPQLDFSTRFFNSGIPDPCYKYHHHYLSPTTVWIKHVETAKIKVLTKTWPHYNLRFFFSIWILFHKHPGITGLQGKGDGIPFPHYHFHPLHRHLDIDRASAGGSPLHIASSRTRTGNLWFPCASR